MSGPRLDSVASGAVGIIGAGTMGIGIAAMFAAAGLSVIIIEPDNDTRARAADRVRALLDGKETHLACYPDVKEIADAKIVIEAVPEILDLKRTLYRQIFDTIGSDAIVVSNTSSILPDALAAELSPDEASRFAIAHFWHPPHRIRLVEIVPGTATAAETTDIVVKTLRSAGLRPVVLSRAAPGFIGNRIQFAVLREALHIVESGVATAEQVDEVVRTSLGRRWAASGPIESADQGGLQTFRNIARLLFPELAHGEEGLAALSERVAGHHLGVATGQGFYTWTKERSSKVEARQSALDTAVADI